jgi:hypothetical protein
LDLNMFPIVPLQVLSGCLESLSTTLARLFIGTPEGLISFVHVGIIES